MNVSIVKAIEASGEPKTVKADCLRYMGICTTMGPGGAGVLGNFDLA
jgi:hypothetical protein